MLALIQTECSVRPAAEGGPPLEPPPVIRLVIDTSEPDTDMLMPILYTAVDALSAEVAEDFSDGWSTAGCQRVQTASHPGTILQASLTCVSQRIDPGHI